jgi:hypothetical protein
MTMPHQVIWDGDALAGGCFPIVVGVLIAFCVGSLFAALSPAIPKIVAIVIVIAIIAAIAACLAGMCFGLAWFRRRWRLIWGLFTFRSIRVSKLAATVDQLRAADAKSIKITSKLLKSRVIAETLREQDRAIAQRKLAILRGQLVKVREQASTDLARAVAIKEALLLQIGDIRGARFERLVTQMNKQLDEADKVFQRIGKRSDEC